jgi:hypothetical protein
MLLQSVLAAAGVNPKYSKLIAGVQAAIAELEKVKGTDVTFNQLEGLRVTPTWPTLPGS